jgi:hypothetical protein
MKYGKKANWIAKRYGKYERKVSWKVKRYEKYGRKVTWIVKWYGKYGRKASYCPYLITIRLAFLPYFPYHFTILFCIFQILSLFDWKASQRVKRFGKYRRKLWKDMTNMEEK